MTTMNTPHVDRSFAGSIPQLYETQLVPLIFEPYAPDLAARVAALRPTRVLEVAAGTGVVTRQLARVLPQETQIVATDLNQPMLDMAAAVGTARDVVWQQADAMMLPFDDAAFDVVVCQFGVMFFADPAGAYAQVRRVLRPGGRFVFNVWDRIEENEFADVVTQSLVPLFPADPPRFLARTPHGHHDCDVIAAQLSRGGFAVAGMSIETRAARSRADAPSAPAIAYCQGTPLRNEIEARDAGGVDRATATATAAVAARFGSGPVDGKIQAHIISIAR